MGFEKFDDLAESQALLALYSGGRAGKVPEGWAVRNGSLSLATADGDGAWVDADGTWHTFAGNDYADTPGPRPILTAIAEAEAWLASKEAPDGR